MTAPRTAALRDRVAMVNWYHTLDLGGGVVTPGHFDCRSIARRVSWPALAGARCLDVGTHDGFWAFEMERRGAAEVVAIDLDDVSARDWPLDARTSGPARIKEWRWEPGEGFRLAAEARGSSVRRVDKNVYDLAGGDLGAFDVVFLGSLLLHLRDPVRALEAVRSVCRGTFLVVDSIDARLDLLARGVPAARFDGVGMDQQWWSANRAGLRRMLSSAGFRVVAESGPFVTPFGRGPLVGRQGARYRLRNALTARDPRPGIIQTALRAEPRPVR